MTGIEQRPPGGHDDMAAPTAPIAAPVDPTWPGVPQPSPVPPAHHGATFPAVHMAAAHSPTRQASGALVAVAWVLTIITLLYLLPWAVAVTRAKSNHGAIALLNVLLGWTFIGWVAALVMACMAEPSSPTTIVVAHQPPANGGPPAGWYPSPNGDGQRYWDGVAWTNHRAP